MELSKNEVITLLNRIVELELAGPSATRNILSWYSDMLEFRSCIGCESKPRNLYFMLHKPERK